MNRFALALFLSVSGLFAETLSEADAEAIGIEAYIYGYPLVTMDMTKRVMTNAVSPSNHKAPVGQFFHAKTFPNASFRDVTAPNADTLYSTAWLDLSKEPYILHLPEEKDRYFLMPLLSGWTDVFADPGVRTTGTEASDYAITGPFWKGVLPQGLKEFKSPTNLVWILGRTYSTGTAEDYALVHKIQEQYTLKPLSYYGKSYAPPKGSINASIDTKTPVKDQVNLLKAEEFFKRLALLMKDNPPSAKDGPLVAKMAKIGIVPGQPFILNRLDPRVIQALTQVPKLAQAEIMKHQKDAGKDVNGWTFSFDTGDYGVNYLQRAYIAAIGLGANKPEDAIYPFALNDSNGKPLNGKNNYVIHFDKGETPPVKGFWSLTMYDDKFFFVNNQLNRYSLGPKNHLSYNQDGSLDLYIQNPTPGRGKESNWLPAPKGPFILMLRIYSPEEAVLNGNWKPPSIKISKAIGL